MQATTPFAVESEVAPPRKAWQVPTIEDADVNALTQGTGSSGVEGTPFLKAGS